MEKYLKRIRVYSLAWSWRISRFLSREHATDII